MNANSLLEFISVEREHYAGMDNNRFANSLRQAIRYHEFILIISERHQIVSQELISSTKQLQSQFVGSGVVTDDQMILLKEQSRLSTLVHLEIESFYLFAKILLDKLAFFLQDYFGKVRGCSLISHNKLIKEYEKFGSAKELVYPKNFSETLKLLKRLIADFRDKQITHLHNPRSIKPTTFDKSGQTQIIVTYLYPNKRELEREQIMSIKLPELLQSIELYVQQIIEIIISNRDKTRFNLKN